VCRAADGRIFPFILRQMRIRSGQIAPPAMQLIYCRDIADYVVCAGTIGRYLLTRGKIAVVLDLAKSPVEKISSAAAQAGPLRRQCGLSHLD
jgi:hypothetical protein